MKTYIQYRDEIISLRSVGETVKAIEKISASQIFFFKKKVQSLQKYTNELEALLSALPEQENNEKNNNSQKSQGSALVIIGGTKGLVAGVYHNLVNAFLERQNTYKYIIAVGEKIIQYLQEELVEITHTVDLADEIPVFDDAVDLTQYLFDGMQQGWDRVDILYTRFISLTQQDPMFAPFLPFSSRIRKEVPQQSNSSQGLPIFEPSASAVSKWGTLRYLETYLYRMLLEAKLCEFSSRTVTAEHAYKKTDELRVFLEKSFNKQRHRILTQKQIESFSAHELLWKKNTDK